MNVNDLKKAYARLPGRIIKRVKETPFSGEPKDYVLNFGQHVGTALKDTPVSYLMWIIENVSNHPVCVSVVRQYLNGEKPSVSIKGEPSPTRRKLSGLTPKPAKQGSGVEGEPPLFQPYVMPIFSHPMSETVLNGKKLKDISLREFQQMPEASDPVLEYFIAKLVHGYRHSVWKVYRESVRIDVSRLSSGEALQYEVILDAVRKIQHVLDTQPDAWEAFKVLHGREAYRTFEMKLPAV